MAAFGIERLAARERIEWKGRVLEVEGEPDRWEPRFGHVHYETRLRHVEGSTMDAFHGFLLDRDGVRELLNSDGFQDAVQAAADQVGAVARGAGHRATSGEPLPVEVFDDPRHDRVGVTVAVHHPAGVGIEARYGLLKRAAEATGLEVDGLDSDGQP
ncbi:hypothetical protein [Saccharothrix xinjiangensis]|uniref:Uncharacterized protein n=1 Tax=Saccharothrix xinjiangensis TaxID=204798 RepID=A0ABV9Y0Y8_9PSEU